HATSLIFTILVYIMHSSTPYSVPFFFSMTHRPPISTLFPYTTLFRSFVTQADALNQHHRETFTTRFPKAPSRWLSHYARATGWADRKSTRLNSSHVAISYAVFCLKKKNYRSSRRFQISSHLKFFNFEQ